MSPRSYYSDEEDVDIHVRHRERSPGPARYVQSPPRPRSYYGAAGSSFLIPEQRTTVVARTRSRERSRSRDRYDSPPQPAAAGPVIINNRVYYDHSSDEDDRSDKYDERRHSSSRRRRSRSRSYSRTSYVEHEDREAEAARRELERMRLARAAEIEERRFEKEYRDEAELRRAKRELDDIRLREARVEDEKRIKKELDYKRLKEQEDEAEEKKRRDKAAAEAVERYKRHELERAAKEKKEQAEDEKDYRRRLVDDLLKSGLDEKAIAAVLNGEKVPEGFEVGQSTSKGRPTYTRMSRKYLSIETLRTFRVEYDTDTDPEYLLIKRWVPEWEQDRFWKHTKYVREKREKTLLIEERKHSRHEPQFEWVRKKEDRKRSKSPALLTYLAGGRPH